MQFRLQRSGLVSKVMRHGPLCRSMLAEALRCVEEIVNSLRRDVRSYVAEGEGLVGGAMPSGYARSREAIIEVEQFSGGIPKSSR